MDKPKKEIKQEEGMVKVTTSDLENLQKRLTALESDKEMLLQIADKKQLGIYYERHRGKLPSRVNLRTMNDKVILGWRTTQDEVYQDPVTMRWTEKQKVEVLYEDGTAEEFYLMDYVRRYKQVEAEVKSKIVDEVTGNVALKVVRLDNGKEYTIGVTFIN